MLTDNLNKKIDYLRISITDRCNLRCMYCMPREGIIQRPPAELLSFEEVVRLVNIFASLGVSKIRLTGGEVFLRRNIVNLIKSLTEIKGIEEVSLTTNGTLLYLYVDKLETLGVKRINISLDTLREDRFKRITQGDSIHKVFEGIDKAREVGLQPLKLNMVVMKGINDDEIIDFMEFSFSKGIILRFIEFMDITPMWREEYFMSIEEVMKICQSQSSLGRLGSPGPGPAVYYKTKQGGVLGFISTDEYNCKFCSRLRLTSAGELRRCLYETAGLSLREFLRNSFSDEKIKAVIQGRMNTKLYTDYRTYRSSQFYMCSIGG